MKFVTCPKCGSIDVLVRKVRTEIQVFGFEVADDGTVVLDLIDTLDSSHVNEIKPSEFYLSVTCGGCGNILINPPSKEKDFSKFLANAGWINEENPTLKYLESLGLTKIELNL